MTHHVVSMMTALRRGFALHCLVSQTVFSGMHVPGKIAIFEFGRSLYGDQESSVHVNFF